MRLLLIVNERAASGKHAGSLPRILEALAARGVSAEAATTLPGGRTASLVGAADLSGYDGLVAVGGDGTLFEVLNGLLQHAPEARPPLGVVPLGTGNAFSKDLGLADRDWRAAVDKLTRGSTFRVDVGHAATPSDAFHFLNIIGLGLPVAAGQVANRLKWAGPGAYTLGTLWQLRRLRTVPLRLRLDGRPLERDGLLIEASNSRYTGTHFLIAPAARLDDGLLDVTLVAGLTRRRLLRLLPTVYSGGHLRFEEVSTWQVRELCIDAPADLPLSVDGELRGTSPVTIRCLPRAVEMFC
ncbi:MAG: YegS/Rv2252/BmrU family lipid kinase [Xanthomonadales bacterium]|nr:YegS/Rv2252/BmrU family lipid kinase [Xanthomonadales bacterium]NIN60763.1 YegS/Rv2252/BmrU family lipid kinase [Xanthomonadales bacterium]NIN76125.1 YegS/Rv2252/BmrU family lipid kinase [Xanthomonadales bacterium]NIO15346.1 YegS/Rv2252/BmrU family lipid kinase [Xanthomonadales bacterium]NIP13156.1 YegS/Rv2252/BmrU family lipid kinase [Xanthomonadales bacterium]